VSEARNAPDKIAVTRRPRPGVTAVVTGFGGVGVAAVVMVTVSIVGGSGTAASMAGFGEAVDAGALII
jgi:hypothetical protein